ncbi:Disease resistance protein [Actinidia chinensis var. chinensis]|uniref:Disease resistance protein n=1 Tax=Actinidia chinensis var. chinensis TaxID=1590841 RepID=A0A2R6R8X4_ACTCC|nr:Disease resistance protein [Actinidia chinensis var. chinensis]
MAEEISGAGECLVLPIKHQFGNMFFFNYNIRNLEAQLELLQMTRQGVLLGVYVGNRSIKIVGSEVEDWLTKVNEATAEAERILDCKAKVQNGCLNLKSVYSLSRKAMETAQVLVRLRDVGIEFKAANFTQSADFEEVESRISTMDEIIEALKDDEINLIGICGMAGVGKTTLAKEVAERALTEHLFDEVETVVVCQNLTKLQSRIAKMLGLKLDVENPRKRACWIPSTILQKVLVILDDVWEEFYHEHLGLLLGNGNKVIYTSRHQNLWSEIETKKEIRLEVLSNKEAWNLFWEKAGDSAKYSCLLPLALAIMKECGGLPLALVTVGRSLMHKKEVVVWNDVLQQLRTPHAKSISLGVLANLSRSIELSYNYLQDEKAKSLFLLCCLFGKDYSIPIEDLVSYAIGLQLFEGIHELGQARNRVHLLVDQLKSCYLLLDGDDDEQVKMHLVVHNVAISIASGDKHGFIISHGRKLRMWPKKDNYEHCNSISIISKYITEVPEGLRCPNLELLLLKCPHSKIPSNFFQETVELKVLELRSMRIRLQPSSFQFLQNLRTLCLHCCSFVHISGIGALSNLEILRIRGSIIMELPKEIERMVNLRLLDLSGCELFERISPGVISGLVGLEELYMRGNYFSNWDGERKEEGINVNLQEFESLSSLNTLDIHITDAAHLPRIPLFSKLTKYKISIGGFHLNSVISLRFQKSLALSLSTSIPSECGINRLLKTAEYIYLEGEGSKDLVHDLVREGVEGLQHLKTLIVRTCETPECLINTTDEVLLANTTAPAVFPNLKSLFLSFLPNLREINHGQLPAGSFGQLKEIFIANCGIMEEIIKKGRCEDVRDATNKIEFTKLESMELVQLPRLISFCRGIDEIEFPILKTLCLINLSSDSEENHDAAFLSIFPQKVAFPSLEELDLKGLAKLTHLCGKYHHVNLFENLSFLRVTACDNLRNLFSSSMARGLVHLQQLVIESCLTMELVVAKEEEEQEIGTCRTLFPLLSKLELGNLPKLRSFCHITHPTELPLLENVDIWDCPNMGPFSIGLVSTPNWPPVDAFYEGSMKAEHLPENLRGKEADEITTPLFGESVPIIKDEMKSTTEEMNSQENEERTINSAGCLHGKSSLPVQDKLKPKFVLEHELTLQEKLTSTEEITQTEVMPEQRNEAKAIGVASFKEFIPGISVHHESEHTAECEIVQVPVADPAATACDSSIGTELEIEMIRLATKEILPVDEFKSAFVCSEIEGLEPILKIKTKIRASETKRERQPKPELSVDPTMLIMTSVKGRWMQCIDLQLVVFHCDQLTELHNVIKDLGFGEVLLGEDDYLVFVRSNEKIKKPPKPESDQGKIFEGESSSIVSLGRPNTPSISFPEGFILRKAGEGLTESPLEENWEQPCVIALMKNEFSSLPTKPNCPNLRFLFLQNNRFLRTISDSFFDDMPSLEVLDLSKTRVRSLPASLFKLTGLQALFVRDCNSLDELPPEVGNLEQIKVLDLWGTEVYNLPDEIAKLKHLRSLRVSFYGTDDDSEYDYLPPALISSGIISKLVSLESLSIAVHPLDWRWTNNAEAITRDVCSLGKLIYLQFHFPGVNCLELFIQESLSWKACHLGKFKFAVGKDINRLVSRVPDNVEFEYYKHERCLRFVNGDGIPREIAGVLERVTAFYLDHHWVMKSLSEFGINIFKELKFCLVSECPKLVEITSSTQRTVCVLPCLQHLSLHYLWRLERIWRGPVAPGSLDSLKVLFVHTCPRLEFIVASSILHCLSNLEELVIEDCASVKVIIEMDGETVSYGSILPCLKEIKLRYLPQLVSLSNGVCPISAHISVYACPKLKNSHNLTTKDIEAQNILGRAVK